MPTSTHTPLVIEVSKRMHALEGRKRTQSHSEKDDYGVHLKAAWAASGHRLSRGLPNTDGARSSRNRSNRALTPTPCPDAALSGSTASTANCQVVAV
jgi:hypothetical protein